MPNNIKGQIELSIGTTLRYMGALVSAMPTSHGMQITNLKAPRLLTEATKITVFDLLPMLLLYGMHAAVASVFESQKEDTCCCR